MSFIAGYFSKTDKCETSSLKEKIRSFCILPGEDPESYENLAIETRFGHVIQKYKRNYPLQSKPCRDKDGNLLANLGFFYNPDSTSRREDLVERCAGNSAKALEECEGEFVAVFIEGITGKVHIVNDRFASRPFYILTNTDHVYFSSSLDFLLYLAGGNHSVDILGWFEVVSFAHTCGMRTTFSDVKRLLPGTHLTLSPDGGLKERRYWRLEHKPEQDLDPIAYSREVFDSFQTGAALRAKLVGKGVVALSGGLDSRLVAATIPGDLEYSAFTFVNSSKTASTPDTRAAAHVCKILGLNHHIQQVPRQQFFNVAGQVIKLTGGLRPLQHMAIVMSYIHEIKTRGLNYLLGGGPGDSLAGSFIPSVHYLDPNRIDACIKDFCRRRASHGNALASLFREELVKQFAPAIYRSLLESFEEISGPTAAHRVTAWVMIYRQPAFTFTSLIHNHPDVMETFCHLDYKYSDLMLRLPAEWLYKRNFYAFMIYNNLPELREVVYANTGKPLSGEMIEYSYKEPLFKRARSLVGDARRYIVHRNAITKKIVQVTKFRHMPPAQPSFAYSLFRDDEDLLTEITECLHSYRSLHEILDINKCLRFMDDFKACNYQGRSQDQQVETMGTLATLCLSIKYLNQ